MLGMSVQARWLLGIAVIWVNILSGDRGFAQITPDGTLPNNSVVAPNGSTFNITGGTLSGANLFHSFREFSVPTGGTAFFNNAVDIQNIISRVTGGSISNIDGLIRTLGSANLFLINPNGIIFGPNASLNVGGSFVASSASAIKFGNQGFFSATNPDTPALLTINPSALFFNQLTIPGISNSSVAPAGLNPIGVEVTGLRVPDGKSLLLVGGDVNINGGSLRAYGGRVELAAIKAPTEVGLDVGQNTLTIRMTEDVQRANVSLSNGAEVNVRALDGGSIAINAQNVNMFGGSKLLAGIESGLGTQQSKAGDIEINAKGETVLSDGSLIANVVQPNAVGQGGNINITTGALTLSNGAALNTTTFGQGNGGSVSVFSSGPVSLVDGDILTSVKAGAVGNGGDINIQGTSLSLTDGAQLISAVREADSTNPAGRGNAGNVNINVQDALTISGEKDGFVSGIFSSIKPGAIGNGGNISISAGSVTLTSGSILDAGSYGLGNGGNITINARDTVTFDGVDSNGIPTRARTALLDSGEGIAGDIKITTGSLFLSNGAFIFSDTFGKGNGGSITINARDTVSVDKSYISSDVQKLAVGNGADIRVTTGTLSVTNGGQLSSDVLGQGNAGNITIDARDTVKLDGIVGYAIAGIQSDLLTGAGKGGDIFVTTGSLSVTNGAKLSANTNGRGNAGNITINARDTVTFDGVGNNESPLPSGASTTVGSNGIGKGGDIRVNARELLLKNGGELATSNFGQGASTLALTPLLDSGEGIAGDIKITTESLFLSNGALIFSDTFGKGNGGSITINARDTVSVDKSYISSDVNKQAVGNGGDIRVTTGSLSLTNGAQVSSEVTGQGNAGNITIDARDTVKLDGIVGNAIAGIQSDLLTGAGKGGDIFVTTGSLSVTNGAELSANTDGRGNAGNITINARDTITFDGVGNNESLLPSGAYTTVGSNGIGKGGDIRVSARELLLKNGGQLGTYSSGQGKAGNIQINVSDTVTFDGSSNNGFGSGANTFASENSSKAGDIFVTTGTISLTNGGRLDTNAKAFAGNITINARDAVIFDGTNDKRGLPSGANSLLLDGSPGKAGDIKVTTGSLTVRNGAFVTSFTSGQGDAGNVIIDARNSVSFDNGFAFSAVAQTGVGKGGDIRISAEEMSVTNGAALVASTFGKGDAGNVIIDARGRVSFDGTSSDAFSRVEQTGVGKGGDIRISAEELSVTNGAQLVANTNGQGDAGNIEINAKNSVSVSGTSSSSGRSSGLFTSTTNSSTGSGGDITVNTPVLRVSDGAVLDARTTNNRNGGNITLNVKLAEILNGGQLLSTSSGAGNAGKITVNATDRVTVDGRDSTFNTRLAKFGPDVVDPVDASSGFFVRSQSTGSAGDIEVTSQQIRLDNEARFIAESASGNGGNINLQVRDLLLLRHGSLISTSAGTANAGGNGGNITINSPNGFIVALPDENSDISANAYTGIGGRVQINATGVYGIQFRDKQNPQTSDITASSEFGSAGTVQLNIPNNDPTQGLSTLSGELVNVENLIANSCIARTKQKQGGTFFITGADGLPNRPGDVSVSSYPTGEVRSLPDRDKGYRVSTSRPWRKGDPIVEPQGVYQLPNGHLVLSRECNN